MIMKFYPYPHAARHCRLQRPMFSVQLFIKLTLQKLYIEIIQFLFSRKYIFVILSIMLNYVPVHVTLLLRPGLLAEENLFS